MSYSEIYCLMIGAHYEPYLKPIKYHRPNGEILFAVFFQKSAWISRLFDPDTPAFLLAAVLFCQRDSRFMSASFGRRERIAAKNGEPASELLKRIQAEKAALINYYYKSIDADTPECISLADIRFCAQTAISDEAEPSPSSL